MSNKNELVEEFSDMLDEMLVHLDEDEKMDDELVIIRELTEQLSEELKTLLDE